MIFVSLGTQDKAFTRILDYLENSDIKDEIIVQAGYTKYKSQKMKIIPYLDKEEFETYISKADYIVCHGGVGTIINCLKQNKKILCVPRLAKYKEHQNDHQLQIASAYAKKGYILVMLESDDFSKKIAELYNFKPNKFVSNNQNFIEKLKDYIDR